jgi:DNA-binding transcriptional MerR regulator
MRIGELARRVRLPRDTIRFYEREGLIASEASVEATNDYRDYPEELVERLTMISEARSAGFSIADLQKLFRCLEALDADPESVERFLDDKMAELRTVIETSQRLLTTLRRTKRALGGPAPTRRRVRRKR